MHEMQKYDRTYLDLENARCLSDVDIKIDWNSCFNQYLEEQLGCALPWLGHDDGTDAHFLPKCDKNSQEQLFSIQSEYCVIGACVIPRPSATSL